MQRTTKPVSILKIALLWLIMIGNLVFWLWFWSRQTSNGGPAPGDEAPGLAMVRAIVFLIAGGFFLALGVGAYFLVLLTNCFTFDFRRPFLPGYKGKQYLAKIVVPLLVSLGVGIILIVVIEPLVRTFGGGQQLGFMLPIFMAIIPMQIVTMWVDIWTPVIRRLIAKRLAARGIHPAQLQNGILIGISNPEHSSLKKFTLVEEDMGALWLAPDQLIYWGDSDQFAITPQQILQLERRADGASMSMLSGTAHVILHVQLLDGSVRQIRFHMENYWTQSGSRRAMDGFAETVSRWHENALAATAPQHPPGS